MKTLATALIAAIAASASFADPVSVTNEILTVNQNGEISKPGILGTVSDVARLQAETRIAAAKAEEADKVYADTTNLLHDVAQQLVNRNAVVYRRYFMDAFTAAVIIGDDDRCAIYGWEKAPASAQDEPGRVKWYCHYGCTADILSMKGIFKTNSDLTVSRKEWEYLDEGYVSDIQTEPGPYTDPVSHDVYDNCYRATVSIPDGISQFLIISIPNQQADTDGATVLVYGGQKDGITTVIHDGNLAYEVTGGYVTGVHETEPNE